MVETARPNHYWLLCLDHDFHSFGPTHRPSCWCSSISKNCLDPTSKMVCINTKHLCFVSFDPNLRPSPIFLFIPSIPSTYTPVHHLPHRQILQPLLGISLPSSHPLHHPPCPHVTELTPNECKAIPVPPLLEIKTCEAYPTKPQSLFISCSISQEEGWKLAVLCRLQGSQHNSSERPFSDAHHRWSAWWLGSCFLVLQARFTPGLSPDSYGERRYIPNMTFFTHHGYYKLKIISLNLCNASLTF